MTATQATAREIAVNVLAHVGGRTNVVANSLCMTRLRLRLSNPGLVDTDALENVDGVLGLAARGSDGIEVVFGPRLVSDVYLSFIELTGVDPTNDKTRGTTPMARKFRVSISPSRQRSYQAQSAIRSSNPLQDPNPAGPRDESVDDLAGLDALFSQERSTAADAASGDPTEDDESDGARLLVINGPNINMLGIREPDVYGAHGYDELLMLCKQTARECGFVECSCFQSNHEGDIVDRIQDAHRVFDGIIINPGAYTHTSVAILDALKAVQIPAIEVHISAIEQREDFRQISYVRDACFETITGLGIDGYRKAIIDMAEHLGL